MMKCGKLFVVGMMLIGLIITAGAMAADASEEGPSPWDALWTGEGFAPAPKAPADSPKAREENVDLKACGCGWAKEIQYRAPSEIPVPEALVAEWRKLPLTDERVMNAWKAAYQQREWKAYLRGLSPCARAGLLAWQSRYEESESLRALMEAIAREAGKERTPEEAEAFAERSARAARDRVLIAAGYDPVLVTRRTGRRMNSGAHGKHRDGPPSQPAGTGSNALVREGNGGEIASSVPAEARVQTGHSGTWIASSVPAEVRARAQSAYEQAYTPAPLALLAEPYPWRAEPAQGAAYVEAYTTPHGMGRTDESPYSQTFIEAYPRQIAAFFVELRSGHTTSVQSTHTRAYRAYLGASPAAGDPTATPLSGPTECPGTPPCGDPFTDVCGQTQPPDEDQCVKCRMSCPNGACCTLTEVKTYKYVYDRLHSWESGAGNCFCLDNDGKRCHESEFCEGKLKHYAYKAEQTTRKVGVCGGLLTTDYDAPETYKEEKWCGSCCELYPQCVVCYPIGWQEGCSGCDVDLTIPRTRVQVDRYNPCTPAVGCRADCCTQQECQACI